ncbi:hypothetical protein ACQPYK_49585 (plasmid) [Streptosporangium sp. CA-135522]|uniref:hypothetical protein n=1 Tax=Streptosporangium sp. CA-135522 TaxID=3240072 RepID=UPI003D941797
MTRRIRPAANPNTSRSVIVTKAGLSGWAITTGATDAEGVTKLTLTRDNWTVIVTCQGQTASLAAIQYPGQSYLAGVLSLSMMFRYLCGDRASMSAFARGQRVVVGGRAGVVEDIIPNEAKVRLVVRYDNGSLGEPYTTHVRAEKEVTA